VKGKKRHKNGTFRNNNKAAEVGANMIRAGEASHLSRCNSSLSVDCTPLWQLSAMRRVEDDRSCDLSYGPLGSQAPREASGANRRRAAGLVTRALVRARKPSSGRRLSRCRLHTVNGARPADGA
jgi:hypothetical protein